VELEAIRVYTALFDYSSGQLNFIWNAELIKNDKYDMVGGLGQKTNSNPCQGFFVRILNRKLERYFELVE